MTHQDDDAEQVREFAQSLKNKIASYKHIQGRDRTEVQREQVELLVALEMEFKEALDKDPLCDNAYNYFLDYVLKTHKNILCARTFFRERRKFFSSNVSPAIRDRDLARLKTFHFNYWWIRMVSENLPLGHTCKAVFKRIQDIRTEIATVNLPLAISRARMFWSKTPKSHLSYLDLVGICTEGLMSAIDKYAEAYSHVYRAVIIGRCSGNMIGNYSQTMLHFYPNDRRVIYRAAKFRSKNVEGSYSVDDLVAGINGTDKPITNATTIVDLVAAASHVSADCEVPGDEDGEICSSISKYAAPEHLRPDNLVEEAEARGTMKNAIRTLPLLSKKLLALKGVLSKEEYFGALGT